MKLYRKILAVGVSLMVGAWALPALAQTQAPKDVRPVADPDEVLRSALPENALPDLKVILGAAMANAPRVVDAGLNLETYDTMVTTQRSPMLPHLSVSANPGVYHQKYQLQDQKPNVTTAGSLYYSAGVSQPIFHWGALYRSYQSAQLQKAISERNLGEARRALASDVRRTYFNMVNLANSRTVEYRVLKNMQSDQEYLKAQAKDGFVTQASADSMVTSIDDYRLQLRRSDNNYQSQWRAFRQLTGLEALQPSTPLPTEIPPVDKKVGEILDALSQSFGEYTPAEIANANDRVKVEQYNYDIAKTRLKPLVDVSLSASQQNQHAGGDQNAPPVLTQTFGAYLGVNWNIFDGLASQAEKRRAVISLRRARIAKDQVERDTQETLRNQVETLRVNWKSLQRAEENLTGARDSIETFKKDYEAGISPKKLWDDAVVAADNALYAANSARADYYMQIVNYLSLRGKDPAVNYRSELKPSDAPKN